MRIFHFRFLWFALLSGMSTGGSAEAAETAEAKRPITHETLWLLKQVGAPIASPDGRSVVVAVTQPAYDEKDETADLWIVPGDGSAPPRRLTTANGKEASPAWSPDGTQLAFSAKREGDESAQIYIIAVNGGEARRLTQLTLGARTPQWSPDGTTILFQAPVHRGATNDAANKALAEERKKAKSKVRLYDGFPIRRWDKWLDGVQTHLFVIAADGSKPARDLLAGTQLVGRKGFNGVFGEGASDNLQPAWAPDSQSIVFTATTNLDAAAHAEVIHHLYEVNLSGEEPRSLTKGDLSHEKPGFSPDGKRLSFLTTANKGRYYALDRLAVAPWPWNGTVTSVAPSFDRSVADVAFSPDSRTLYFSAEDGGRVRIWSAPANGGEARLAVDAPQGVWGAFSIPEKATTSLLFANWEAAHSPGECYRVELGNWQRTRLTGFNNEAVAAIDWAALREFWSTNKAGHGIHSFIVLPPGFDESKKYPLFVLIHG
ncbi:MAG TPA: S9 family peptidase, partial [Verrucomicrobiae bacterium]|nr:S9 family peptidase [Verrucomicrobiae bacterium]